MTDLFGVIPDLLTYETCVALVHEEQAHDTGDWAVRQAWIHTRMPILVTFILHADDEAVRELIRGGARRVRSSELQRVVVAGTEEANRIIHTWCQRRSTRGKPVGGQTYVRIPLQA